MLNRLYDSYWQMSAVIKIKMRKERERVDEQTRSTRQGTRRQMQDCGKTKIALESFTLDAGKLWYLQAQKHFSDCYWFLNVAV